MLDNLRSNQKLQLLLGFLMGIVFGFLLQRGGVTRYEIIMGQLLLEDWTVVKVMLSAALTGMIGIYFMKQLGWVKLHRKSGAFGSTVIGGLIFGAGFGVLGYCPGTMAGAVAQGNMDALFGGVVGMLIGAAAYAAAYPLLKKRILDKGQFGDVTIPELLKVNAWIVIAFAAALILLLFRALENAGL